MPAHRKTQDAGGIDRRRSARFVVPNGNGCGTWMIESSVQDRQHDDGIDDDLDEEPAHRRRPRGAREMRSIAAFHARVARTRSGSSAGVDIATSSSKTCALGQRDDVGILEQEVELVVPEQRQVVEVAAADEHPVVDPRGPWRGPSPGGAGSSHPASRSRW